MAVGQEGVDGRWRERDWGVGKGGSTNAAVAGAIVLEGGIRQAGFGLAEEDAGAAACFAACGMGVRDVSSLLTRPKVQTSRVRLDYRQDLHVPKGVQSRILCVHPPPMVAATKRRSAEGGHNWTTMSRFW